VIRLGPGAALSLLNQRVLLVPVLGWDSDPEGPEHNGARYAIIGASTRYPHGTAQDYIVVRAAEVEVCPEHLSHVETAALPLAGLTGWRALVGKSGNAKPGRNILVTGIGGGVALQVLQLAVAMGAPSS
jgi:NADPH:quinone reductase-like Zn-dependent oxidoreductase